MGISEKIGKDWTVFDIIYLFKQLDSFIFQLWDTLLLRSFKKDQKREASGLEEVLIILTGK